MRSVRDFVFDPFSDIWFDSDAGNCYYHYAVHQGDPSGGVMVFLSDSECVF